MLLGNDVELLPTQAQVGIQSQMREDRPWQTTSLSWSQPLPALSVRFPGVWTCTLVGTACHSAVATETLTDHEAENIYYLVVYRNGLMTRHRATCSHQPFQNETSQLAHCSGQMRL